MKQTFCASLRFSLSLFCMSLDLFNLDAIASAAIAINPIASVINAMATVQSSPSPIEIADKWQTRLFVTSAIFAVAAALIGALLGSLLWRANNKYQDAVMADANARIAEAGEGAANARAEAARANEGLAKSNEEIAQLTKEAEALRAEAEKAKAERAEADKQIATAKADAASAAERTAEISLRVEEEARKRAEAQRALLALQERIKDRHLTTAQRNGLIEVLRQFPKGTVLIKCSSIGPESCAFAEEIAATLQLAGWTVIPGGSWVESPPQAGL